MSSNAQGDADEDDFTPDAGSSTDEYVTGAAETGTFITDETPTAGTPIHGSSNVGVNATDANRTDPADDASTGRSASGE
jgi:hypothetical protein